MPTGNLNILYYTDLHLSSIFLFAYHQHLNDKVEEQYTVCATYNLCNEWEKELAFKQFVIAFIVH